MHPLERTDVMLNKLGIFLKNIQFFEQFNGKQRRNLAARIQIRDVPYGRSTVFSQGDFGHDFYVVLRGRCEVCVRSKNGMLNKVAEIDQGMMKLYI